MIRLLPAIVLGLAVAALPARAADTPKSPAKTAQAERMKACNASAKEKSLKGGERKAFMSDCLKKKG